MRRLLGSWTGFFEVRYGAQAIGASASHEISHTRRQYSALLTTARHNRPYWYSRTNLGRVFFFCAKARLVWGKIENTAGKIWRKSPWFAVFESKIMVRHNCCAYG